MGSPTTNWRSPAHRPLPGSGVVFPIIHDARSGA
jgi:hypothetical protein